MEKRTIKFRAWDKQFTTMKVLPLPEAFHLDWDRFELMQYTGLKDKGVEWYEGDIIENDGDRYKIVWDEVYARFEAVHLFDGDDLALTELYVIGTQKLGNIYQNPELLS